VLAYPVRGLRSVAAAALEKVSEGSVLDIGIFGTDPLDPVSVTPRRHPSSHAMDGSSIRPCRDEGRAAGKPRSYERSYVSRKEGTGGDIS
jgi:hypothetical protein